MKAYLTLIAVLIAFFGWLLDKAIEHDRAAAEQFMQECIADGRKSYECKAMWRAGDSQTVVVPMPIYTGK